MGEGPLEEATLALDRVPATELADQPALFARVQELIERALEVEELTDGT